MKRLHYLLPLCLYLLCHSLSGQTTAKVGIRTLALDPSISNAEKYVKTEEGYELLVFLSRHPGELIDAQIGENILPVFEKVQVPGKGLTFQVAHQIKLPGEAKTVLLLGWGSAGNERFLPVNDKILDANYNNWLMINTTSKTVGFQIGKGEKPFVLDPNSIDIRKVTTPANEGAAVLGRARLDDKVKTFYSTYWPIRSGERSIVIFVEQNDRIRVRKISDALLDKKPDTQ